MSGAILGLLGVRTHLGWSSDLRRAQGQSGGPWPESPVTTAFPPGPTYQGLVTK